MSHQPHKYSNEQQAEEYIQKTRKAAGYLRQLLHAQQCDQQPHCTVMPSCHTIKLMLHHVKYCSAAEHSCGVAGCATTKKLLRHVMFCQALGGKSGGHDLDSVCSSFGSDCSSSSTATTAESVPIIGACLLCSIAKGKLVSSSLPPNTTPMASANMSSKSDQSAINPQENSFDSQSEPEGSSCEMETGSNDDMADEDVEAAEEMKPDQDFNKWAPLINDEIISFSKVPFQHHFTALRPRYLYRVNSGYDSSTFPNAKRNKTQEAL